MKETDDIYQLIELLKSETLKYEESSKVIHYSVVVHVYCTSSIGIVRTCMQEITTLELHLVQLSMCVSNVLDKYKNL